MMTVHNNQDRFIPLFFVHRRSALYIGLLSIVFFLSACSTTPDLASVTSDIESIASGIKSYHATGTMTIYTSKKPQQYDVDVRFSQPHFYRISLMNLEKKVQQIILRNEQGVFVITPHLQKSFRFQSDWPNKQGQAYLYETLMQAILSDSSAKFLPQENAYVFDVAANYNNLSLLRQKIWIDRKTLLPNQVVVSDQHMQDAVRMTFRSFELNHAIDRATFDQQQNLTRVSLQSIPLVEEASLTPTSSNFHVYTPTYTPTGVTAQQPFPSPQQQQLDSSLVVSRYHGKYNYTLTQQPTERNSVISNEMGSLLALNDPLTYGILLKTGAFHWTANDQQYVLTSSDLPETELIKIASSLSVALEK